MPIKRVQQAITQSCRMVHRWGSHLLLAALLSGCASALPHATSDTPSPFASFAQAQAAAQRIVPFETRLAQMHQLGFDAGAGKNVTLVPYPDVLARLVPYSGVPMAALDPGIRECIEAKSECRAYLFHFERLQHDREGSFLGDFFNVKRVTEVRGWTFDALVVVSGDLVLFRNVGGQPNISRTKRQTNPLGPLQPAGESAGAILVR